ncbi:hypothetical protein [Streptomyces marianii]|uniref:hypothetical protein n=1 Tax=Streptomyces marianii TaxID=1817406 RepID=UPI00148732B5|nr:hypothetical protein [Streptomyces marianii]
MVTANRDAHGALRVRFETLTMVGERPEHDFVPAPLRQGAPIRYLQLERHAVPSGHHLVLLVDRDNREVWENAGKPIAESCVHWIMKDKLWPIADKVELLRELGTIGKTEHLVGHLVDLSVVPHQEYVRGGCV